MSENREVELAEARRMIVTAQRAFDMQDAVDIPGRTGELNCLQISKAWLELEKRAEAAEQEAERYKRAAESLRAERKQARIDIHNLLAELEAHQELTGESLEEDDAAVVEDIRTRWKEKP